MTPLTVLGQACHGNHMPCHAQVFVIIEVADMATNLTTATDTLEVKTNFRGVQTARDGWNCQRPHLQEGAQRAYSLKNSVGDEFDAPTAPHTIDAYYRRGTHEEVEASMAPWLRKTIDELERKRQSSTTSAQATG